MGLQHFTRTAVGALALALIACGSTPSAPAPVGVVFDDAGEATSSPHTLTVASLSSSDLIPPSAPSNLAWTNADMTVTLTWGASTDAVGVAAYDLWYGNFYLGAFTDTTLALIGFKTSTPYTFTVKARDAAGNVSVASNQVTVLLGITKDTVPPSAPTNLSTSSVSDTRVSLRWTASTDNVGVVLYEVYQGSTLAATAFGSASATVSGLTPGTPYSFTVRAQDAAGNASSFSAPVSATTTGAIDYGVTINSIPGLSNTFDFIKGADVSMLAQLESSGAKFYDESGNAADALQVLRDHGVNWIRLRRWNHPVIAHDFVTDDMTIRAGQSAGGANDVARDALLAKRAKDLGMKVLLDFHFSDWWTDPGKQWTPQAWENLSLAQLETAIHDDTAATLATMKQAGAMPDMVQLGNEITPGLLIHICDGSGAPISTSAVNGSTSNWTNLGTLLKAAAAGVREVDEEIAIALHIDRGGDKATDRPGNALQTSIDWVSNAINQGVPFDVLAESAYQVYQGDPNSDQNTRNSWANTFANLAARFPDLKLLAVEYASLARDINDIVFGLPDQQGLGAFNWEPTREGTWNMRRALFSAAGNQYTATADLSAYDAMRAAYSGRL